MGNNAFDSDFGFLHARRCGGQNLLLSRILLVGTFKVVEINIQDREDYPCRDNAYGSVLPVHVTKIFETQQRREHAIHSSQRARVTITSVLSHDFVLLVPFQLSRVCTQQPHVFFVRLMVLFHEIVCACEN